MIARITSTVCPGTHGRSARPACFTLAVLGALVVGPGNVAGMDAVRPSLSWLHVAPDPATQVAKPFDHNRHTSVACATCHTSGTSVVRNNPAWCANCHHGNRPEGQCVRCHRSGELQGLKVETPFNLPGGLAERSLDFPHEAHAPVGCSACHGRPPRAVSDDFACASCHEEHHGSAEVNCLGCHNGPPSWAHEESLVHNTCAGGLCHKNFDPGDVGRWARPVCTACHQAFSQEDSLPPIPGMSPRDTLPVSGNPPRTHP
ncbi:MAG: hypothetical protein OEZ65_00545 [Gemmatimonadota bacterium]|nr:hypothetical protein [Gemmatimonadota bacterium]MDH5758042.1 hypothetical protein [Gemmatimonadota bacterium]